MDTLLKVVLVSFGLFVFGCNANESFVDTLKPEFETMSFNVVQKQLVIEHELPNYVQNLLSSWFDQRIKVDGFDGDMKFIVTDFNQKISSIDNGKRVDISLSFKVLLNIPSLSQTKLIEGSVSSYGTLTGNFSLNEFDTIIQNAQVDLIIRLSKDLKSKI